MENYILWLEAESTRQVCVHMRQKELPASYMTALIASRGNFSLLSFSELDIQGSMYLQEGHRMGAKLFTENTFLRIFRPTSAPLRIVHEKPQCSRAATNGMLMSWNNIEIRLYGSVGITPGRLLLPKRPLRITCDQITQGLLQTISFLASRTFASRSGKRA